MIEIPNPRIEVKNFALSGRISYIDTDGKIVTILKKFEEKESPSGNIKIKVHVTIKADDELIELYWGGLKTELKRELKIQEEHPEVICKNPQIFTWVNGYYFGRLWRRPYHKRQEEECSTGEQL